MRCSVEVGLGFGRRLTILCVLTVADHYTCIYDFVRVRVYMHVCMCLCVCVYAYVCV